jgi:GTPase SAR1 family protein
MVDSNTQIAGNIIQKENLTFKFVILGDTGVGKTSILHYYIFNKCKCIY